MTGRRFGQGCRLPSLTHPYDHFVDSITFQLEPQSFLEYRSDSVSLVLLVSAAHSAFHRPKKANQILAPNILELVSAKNTRLNDDATQGTRRVRTELRHSCISGFTLPHCFVPPTLPVSAGFGLRGEVTAGFDSISVTTGVGRDVESTLTTRKRGG